MPDYFNLYLPSTVSNTISHFDSTLAINIAAVILETLLDFLWATNSHHTLPNVFTKINAILQVPLKPLQPLHLHVIAIDHPHV